VLHHRVESEVVPAFRGRILDFDEDASIAFARIQAAARSEGRTLGAMNGLVAAICTARGAQVATRDESGFRAVGLDVVNPWSVG